MDNTTAAPLPSEWRRPTPGERVMLALARAGMWGEICTITEDNEIEFWTVERVENKSDTAVSDERAD